MPRQGPLPAALVLPNARPVPSSAAQPLPAAASAGHCVADHRGKLSLDGGTAREGKSAAILSDTSADREGSAHPWQRYLPKNTSWQRRGLRRSAEVTGRAMGCSRCGHRSSGVALSPWAVRLQRRGPAVSARSRSEPRGAGSSPRCVAGAAQVPDSRGSPAAQRLIHPGKNGRGRKK